MAKKKPETRPATLDDLLTGGYRYVPLEEAGPGEAPAAAGEKSSAARRIFGDTGISLLKGAIGLPEAGVGMLDLVTGGQAGKLAEEAGFRPKEAKAILDEYLTPEQKAANAAVQNADGFMGKLGAAVTNPSVIWQGAVESAPSMLGGAAVARGAMAVAPKLPGVIAAGMGEGAISAGQTAEQVRQETPSGTLTGTQAGIAAASGALTGAIGAIAGRVAQKMGIGDVDTLLAGVKHSTPNVQKGVVRQIVEGAFSEGVLEELPQSVQEQVAQNLALGKPLDEGVDHAAVLGMLSGGLMGGVAGPLLGQESPQGKAIRDEKVPEVGPLTRAVNAVTEKRAQDADAGMPTVTADQAAVEAQHRLNELDQKEAGTEEQTLPGPKGDDVEIPGTPGQMLTQSERQEKAFLQDNAENPEALARAQGATVSEAAPAPAIPGAVPPEVALERVEERGAEDIRRLKERSPRGPAGDILSDQGALRRMEGQTFGDDKPTAGDVMYAIDEANQRDEQTRKLYADITRPGGEPFKNKTAAVRAMRSQPNPGDLALATVAGGYVLRPKKETPDGMRDQPAAGPAGSGGTGAADDRGSLDAGGRPAAEPGNAVPARDVPAAAPVADAGLGAQRDDEAVAAVAGAPIDAEWTAFKPESGTKGVPRADMPQIKAEHRGAMTQFLKGRGITHEQEHEVDPATLKPTQAEFSPGKVQKAREFSDTDRAILVSSDGHVLDGHHQWLGAMAENKPIRVIRLDAPIENLIGEVKEFPSATQADGSKAASGDMPALRAKWKGMNDRTDAEVRAAEEWDKAKQALITAVANGYERGNQIGDEVVAEWGQTRIAADQLGYLTELTKRLRAEAQRAKDDEATPGTFANRRAERDNEKRWQDVVDRMHKADLEEIALGEQELRDLYRQGRLNDADVQKVADIASTSRDSHETATRLHDLLASKSIVPAERQVGGKAAAANEPATPTPDERRRKAAEHVRQGVVKRTNANTAMVWQIIHAPTGEAISGPPGRYPGDGLMGGSPTMGNLGWKTKGQAEAALAELRRKADEVLGAPEPAPAPAPRKAPKKIAEQRAAREAKRADYFAPGNIVKGYGGHDEVLSYTPPDENGRWSVKVHRVKKVDGEWVRDGKPQDARQHSTEPDEKELAAGPVARLDHATGASVKYGEPRQDGRAFPNAPDRGVAPAMAEPAAEGADDFLTKLFGTPAEQAAAQAKFEADTEGKKRAMARIREAISTEKKRAQAEHDDWAGRVYKANSRQVDLRGDGPSNRESLSIGSINESRRRKAMEALAQEITALDKLADAVSTDSGTERVLGNLRVLMGKAKAAAESGNWPGETVHSLFESMMLDDLKFRGPGGKGNITSNGLSKAVLAAVQAEAPAPAPTQEANDTPPAWHTTLPEQGGPIVDSDRTYPSNPRSVIDGRRVVARLAAEAFDAVTRTQMQGGMKLTPWVLPATGDRNGVVRLLPEDQKAPAPWQQMGTEPIPVGMLSRDQAIARISDRLRSAPILASDDAAPAAKQDAQAEPEAETDAIDKRIADAEAAGVSLSESDKDKIRAAITKADELHRQANRHSIAASDPMRKGNAFPMGVGFTKMTKRAEQRIDASVKRAGEYVKAFNKAEQAQKAADELLAGRGTDADNARKAEKRAEAQRLLVGKLVNWTKGEKIGQFTIERVNKDADGYPATYTIGGDGIVKGVMDKVDVAREFFSGDKAAFRAMVDETRTAQPADAAKGSHVESIKATMRAIYDGTASVEEYRAGYALARDAAAVKTDLGRMTKEDLIQTFGIMARTSEKKESLVDTAYTSLLDGFALGKKYGPTSYFMTRGGLENYKKQQAEALDALVAGQSADDLSAYAAEVKKAREEAAARRAAVMESVKNPQTLDDFRKYITYSMRQGKSEADARRSLTPEQRATFDTLAAEQSRAGRKESKDEQRDVRVAGQTVDGQIIATKHTKKGHDLYVVQLAERVSREDYETLNTSAKKIGGYYSSYRGGGAVPGFQFTERSQAEAFVKLAQGDKADAQAAAAQRRDAFEDDRSQTAVERLTEMADRLEEKADESLGRERKANTERRARMAAGAEAEARHMKALASTMRNIAGAIGEGKAKFLDRVRQKVQVEMLNRLLANAHGDELRAKYQTYGEQEKHQGEAPTAETVEFAEFPRFTAYRSDLASLGRRLLEVDGTKLLGQRIMKVADDVTDAFTAFAKEPGNLLRLSTFSIKSGEERKTAIFPDRESAERAIKRSGLSGKAIVFPEKRGVNRIIMSPSEAMNAGIWKGDGDKRITLTDDFGLELVEKAGRRKGAKDAVPWQFETAAERQKALARMGIETPAEFRSALREFIAMREQPAEADKVKQLERAMVGKRNDGFDFFPTPSSVADEMVEAAGIEPGMRVLEPSAGMGHIAERIRAAGGEPEVIEIASDRRDLLEAKGFNLVGRDFLDFNDANHAGRGFTYGDVFRAPDGTLGVLRGSGGMGSDRVGLDPLDENGQPDPRRSRWETYSDLEPIEKRGVGSGYDRILMNPPFSDGRDIAHVKHAYSLLKPGGRIVAIMGESAFTNSLKRAEEFRDWLAQVGGTEEKLAEGTFLDPSLPVNTGANARMVVIDKDADAAEASTRPADDVAFSRGPNTRTRSDRLREIVDVLTANWANAPEVLVVENMQDEAVPQDVRDADAAQRQGGATDEPAAFIHAGKVYMLASQIGDAKTAIQALFHESLGHFGLRGTFGQELGTILDRIAVLNQGKVRAKARQYGLDFEKQRDRRAAAEEVLAEMAQENPQLGWVKRALAAIRSWLRDNIKGFAKMAFTDAEIINSFILPARRFVTEGSGAPEGFAFQRAKVEDDSGFARTSVLDTLRSAATSRGAANLASDMLQSDRSFNWWHRTIGTQYQKARDNPEFRPVYDAAQDYLHDTSAFANDSAALAPDVVPQLKGWRDAMRSLRLSDADGKALAATVFQGTLNDQRVYTPDELRAQGLTERQIGLYFQFRKAVDRSLDILVATDVARFIGQDMPPALKAMISDGNTGRFRGLVTALAQQKKAEAQDALKAVRKENKKKLAAMWAEQKKRLAGTKPGSRLAIEQSLDEEQAKIRAEVASAERSAQAEVDRWTDFERTTRDKYERIDLLKEQGYAPLMRFGQYTVYVTGELGEQQYFGLYESQSDANRAAREFRESEDFKGSTVQTGILSEEAYKQFSGMAPETLELFAEVSGVEKTPLFEEYLRRAKSNRSALKRLISRKGIAGYSEDAQRVLASFLTSNARAASANLHVGDMTRLVEDIPKEKGDVKDEAIRLKEYVQNPTEEAQRIRGLLFVQYLGGSVASALVNMTQPFMMTFPYLSQFGGPVKAAARLGAAMKDAIGKVSPGTPLGRALAKAEKEGIVSPQELHQLQAESSRTMGNHPGVRRLLFLWGSAFSLAEQFNRRTSFIAAYRTATEQGMADPFKFAADAVDSTQGVYNRGNRPNWARGAVGATLFTFKQYSISYLEFLKRLPPKERAIALLVLVLAAGAQGLPFADDLDDLIDTLGQHLGYDTNAKAWKHQLMADAIGEGAADFALHGFSALPGFPLDVSGRLALGNLIPGSGVLLKNKTDKSGEVFDMLGPIGGAARDALKGEVRPLAIRNLAKSIEMYQTGQYRDTRDRRVIDVDGADAFIKGVGFQPAAVARKSRKLQLSNQQLQLARVVEAEIASEWAQGLADSEPDKVRSARERLRQWNVDNPRSRIAINSGQLQRLVSELRMTRQERFQKTVPREMRGTVE